MNIQQAIIQIMPQLTIEKQQEVLDFMQFLLEKQQQQAAVNNIAQGKRRADILRRIAEDNALSNIADPVAWQQEMRRDRPLPGRK